MERDEISALCFFFLEHRGRKRENNFYANIKNLFSVNREFGGVNGIGNLCL